VPRIKGKGKHGKALQPACAQTGFLPFAARGPEAAHRNKAMIINFGEIAARHGCLGW